MDHYSEYYEERRQGELDTQLRAFTARDTLRNVPLSRFTVDDLRWLTLTWTVDYHRWLPYAEQWIKENLAG